MPQFFSTQEVAVELSRRYGIYVDLWKVRRVFELGEVPEPPKFGNRRVITPELLPAIIERMTARGYLPEVAPSTEVAHV